MDLTVALEVFDPAATSSSSQRTIVFPKYGSLSSRTFYLSSNLPQYSALSRFNRNYTIDFGWYSTLCVLPDLGQWSSTFLLLQQILPDMLIHTLNALMPCDEFAFGCPSESQYRLS
ncbi:hypothetical protein ACTXT7_013310 [Hymenolepis weldensis]